MGSALSPTIVPGGVLASLFNKPSSLSYSRAKKNSNAAKTTANAGKSALISHRRGTGGAVKELLR
jgi:hypothetical protein